MDRDSIPVISCAADERRWKNRRALALDVILEANRQTHRLDISYRVLQAVCCARSNFTLPLLGSQIETRPCRVDVMDAAHG